MIETRAETGWQELTERLRRFVGRRVAAADADDVLQDALIRIQRGLRGLRDDERFGPWVYQVARSAIADHLRARSRPLEARRTLVDENLAAAAVEEDAELAQALVGCLAAFVADLPSPYRDAIRLTELEGLSRKQAAELLGVSLSAVKSRVQRGRERLRRRFERCCELDLDARGRVLSCEPRAGGGACSGAAGRRAGMRRLDARGAGRSEIRVRAEPGTRA